MDKDVLRRYVAGRHSIREIATTEGVSYTTVRYWLKKHRLKTAHHQFGANPPSPVSFRCTRCGETDPSTFYGKRKNRCGRCRNEESLASMRAQRARVVSHMGGRCVDCGYNKHSAAFDVHHLDPTRKDRNWRSWRTWSWNRLLIELEACVLLCRNCHAIRHAHDHASIV